MRRRISTSDLAIDVFVTTPDESAECRDVPDSVVYWPAREGKVVYERAA